MPDEVYSVSDITADIRGSLEDQFSGIWVEGEISNHRLPASGHHYFTLKDSFAQLSCVLFRGAAAKLPITLKDGMQVQIRGNISVYEARGQYQLIAQTVQAKGAGDLQAKFEELKRKLEAEGLFDSEKKKTTAAFSQNNWDRDLSHRRCDSGYGACLCPKGAMGEIADSSGAGSGR